MPNEDTHTPNGSSENGASSLAWGGKRALHGRGGISAGS